MASVKADPLYSFLSTSANFLLSARLIWAIATSSGVRLALAGLHLFFPRERDFTLFNLLSHKSDFVNNPGQGKKLSTAQISCLFTNGRHLPQVLEEEIVKADETEKKDVAHPVASDARQ